MKKSYIKIFALAALAFAINSCKNHNAEEVRYITVKTSIGPLTRTTTNNGIQNFVNGDKISVYAWTGSANTINTSDLVVNNSLNTYNSSTWAAEPQMLWKDMTTPHFFMSIFPTKAITNFTTDSYTFDPSKTEEQNDLLVAVNTGINNAGLTATTTGIPLQFDHLMAKLIVNLTFRNQWSSRPTVSSVTTNVATQATVNYLTKTATATTGNLADIVLNVTTPDTSYESIMIPQSNETFKITTKIGDKEMIYKGHVTLEGGKYTTVNLIVGRDEITLGSVSINPWGEGSTIDNGEAQEE